MMKFVAQRKMMRIVLTLIFLVFLFQTQAQKLSGQWTGGFVSSGDFYGGKTEYVLEIEIKGDEVSGYSYTYFNIVGKRCYVICRLTGNYDKESKSLVVSEVEKVKSNTPPDFKDCFQTHMLTYFKSGDTELLQGKWKPATIKDNCGTGNTELERKALVKIIPKKTDSGIAKTTVPKPKTTKPVTKPVAKAAAPVKKPATTGTTPKPNSTAKNTPPNTTRSSVPKTTTATAKPPATKKPDSSVVENKNIQKPATIDKTLPDNEKPKAPSSITGPSSISKIEKRSKQIIRVIEVDAKSFKVDMYDNGQIDGDTISLFFNGKLMVSRQRLSTDPIHLNITMDPTRTDNELVMYAENLGSIPPNTALMIVTVGDKRYEVNISSSEQTSGTVRFKLSD